MPRGGAVGTTEFLLTGIIGTASLLVGRDLLGPVVSSVQNVPVAIVMPAPLALALAALVGIVGTRWRGFAVVEREEVAAGTAVVRAGDRSDDVFMREGRALSIHVAARYGAHCRVCTRKPGSIVGEIAACAGLPRSANVEADSDSVAYRMRAARLAETRAHRPDLAAGWHRAMATALAEKRDRANKLPG